MSLAFLLELGVEEIPDWMIVPALGNLSELFSALLAEHRLGGEVSAVDATPRRLVLRAGPSLAAQPDQTVSVSGPPTSASEGAVAGFAKKQGVNLTDLRKVVTPKGEYWTVGKDIPGRRTVEVLGEALPGIVGKIYFPKTMYWTSRTGPRFIRPIRWIVALLGEDVVPFTFAGVSSGNTTSGHRILGKPNTIVNIANYEQQLKQNGVVLSAAERRSRIEAALDAGVVRDEELLETLVYLTEFPTPLRGTFDPAFLELPKEILTTVMRHHQRYFSVADQDGTLQPEFIAVMNSDGDPDGLVQKGHERVLRARFNDARFFWSVDLKRMLGDRVEDLRNVTFQAKLGSYYEKTRRVADLAKELAVTLHENTSYATCAAGLCKCDLTTEMVKEFTELQGVVGGLYAKHQGAPEPVWRAVYEHYKPVSMEDSIPGGRIGQIVALADKADTLRGCFAIGLVPTGSKDPFALRRAAQGVIKILVEGKLPLALSTLTAGDSQLHEFLIDRVRHYFREVCGYKYDEVNAALASRSDLLVDLQERLEAIRLVRPTADFEPLAASFKRIQNILRQADFQPTGPIDPDLLEAGPEADLAAAVVATKQKISRQGTYHEVLASIADLRPAVDKFFDKVLVNAPDERLRCNRLTLLSSLISEFSAIADFSEIVVNTQP
ncbi:MAG: glycine--tRNA ligase subunit beta [Bryobacteraceae bacterium]|nr:glycine--tRNA ligase subunit beta [Bryobacteraceae bacterium]